MDFSLSWPDTLHLLSLNVAKLRPWHGVFGAADSLALALTTVLFWLKNQNKTKNPKLLAGCYRQDIRFQKWQHLFGLFSFSPLQHKVQLLCAFIIFFLSTFNQKLVTCHRVLLTRDSSLDPHLHSSETSLSDSCRLLVTVLSKGSLFMFNQEDQLPPHSIITLWEAQIPICFGTCGAQSA